MNLLCFSLITVARCEVSTNTSPGRLFQFKFDPQKPLVYTVDYKTRTVRDVHSGQRSSLTSDSVDTRYKFRLSASGTNQDGTTAVYYEPFDFEQDIQSAGPGGETDTTIRGLTIVGKQNGVVVIDTEKGVGISQSQNLKQAVYPHLLTGYFDFDPTGKIQKSEGDMPFIDTWHNNLKYTKALFYFTFPTNAIAVQDSWTNYVIVKTSGGMVVNGEGIIQPWVISREPDQTASNSLIANFTLSMYDNYKNISGRIDQLGQQTSVAIPAHNEYINATFQFDQKSGWLTAMKKSETTHDDFSMIVQGNSTESHIDISADISITLISP